MLHAGNHHVKKPVYGSNGAPRCWDKMAYRGTLLMREDPVHGAECATRYPGTTTRTPFVCMESKGADN